MNDSDSNFDLGLYKCPVCILGYLLWVDDPASHHDRKCVTCGWCRISPRGVEAKLDRLLETEQFSTMAKLNIMIEINDIEKEYQLDIDDELNREADEAIYCHRYGPCDKCKENDNNEELK